MSKLSSKILERVFILLDQQDKVQCMLVCQQWNQIITSFCLFETICLKKKSSFQKLRSRFDDNDTLQLQTRRVLLLFNMKSSFDFVSLFPNLQVIFVHKMCHEIIVDELQVEPEKKLRCHTIESLIQTSGYTLANNILSTTFCPNLKTIQITSQGEDLNAKVILSLLKNTPNLKNISMTGFWFSLEEFELLHQQTPQLESVKLYRASTQMDMVELLSADIIPANTVFDFTMSLIYSDLRKSDWPLIYFICMKYPKLNTLRFDVLIAPYIVNKELQIRLTEFLKLLFFNFSDKLQSSDITLPIISDDIFKTLDSNNCKIKNLNIGLINEGQIQGSRLVERLIQSNQVSYINSLWLGNCSVQNFDWLTSLVKLKELTLSFYEHLAETSWQHSYRNKSIMLDEVINSCLETLEKLSIYDFSIQLSSKFITGSCNQSITHLELISERLPLGLDLYITHRLPCLSHLLIKSYSLSYRSFNLPNHHLSYVEFFIENCTMERKLLLVTGTNKYQWFEPRYSYDNYRAYKEYCDIDTTIPFCKPNYSTTNSDSTPDIVFVCASVKKLGFFNYLT